MAIFPTMDPASDPSCHVAYAYMSQPMLPIANLPVNDEWCRSM